MTNCDAAVTPTQWQKRQHPEIFQPKITVQHEGIALHELGPDPAAAIRTPNGTVLKVGDPVITYVARNLEPYRGFHIFMRALERVQKAHATCDAVIIGCDDVSYGKRPKAAPNWREKMLREVELDATRTHFMGRVPRDVFTSDTAPVREVLSESSARLFDFHQAGALSDAVLSALEGQGRSSEMSRHAREVAKRFAPDRSEPQYDLLLRATT